MRPENRHHLSVLFYRSHVRLADVSDGTSNTLLIGERPPSYGVDYGWWYAGVGADAGILDHHIGVHETLRTRYGVCHEATMSFKPTVLHNECCVSQFWSMHSGGAHFSLVDGSVHFFSYGMGETLSQLATRAGGETARF